MYDTVSGGLASFVSALFGFWVSERFGFELVDSADIYYAYVYLLIFLTAVRIYMFSMVTANQKSYKFFYLPIYTYFKNLKYVFKFRA